MVERSAHERRWVVLAVLVLSLMVVVLDNTILNVALKTIQQDLQTTQSELAWAVNAYTLVFAGLLFTYGVLGDRYGRRLALVVGLSIFAAASAVCAAADSAAELIAARALMGLGAAAVLPSTLSIITNVFDADERPRAIGIWAGAAGSAVAIGPVTGGLLLEHFWWGSVFLVNVPVVLLAVPLILWLVPESRDPAPQRLDPLGVLLSVAGLVLLVYGIIEGGETTEWSSAPVVGTVVGGLAVLAVFVLQQRRLAEPVLDVGLFRNPAFSAGCAAVTLAFFALFGAIFFLSFYLQYARAYSPLEAGVRLLPVAVALMVFGPRSAVLARRFGARAVCTAGLVAVAVAFGSYRFVDETTSVWALSAVLFLQGAGMALVMAPATESIMSTVPRERAGAGAAVNSTVRQVGGALGVAVLGSVLAASYRSGITPSLAGLPQRAQELGGESIGGTLLLAEQLPPSTAGPLQQQAVTAFVEAMHTTALCCALVAAVGALVVLRWLPARPPEPQPSAEPAPPVAA